MSDKQDAATNRLDEFVRLLTEHDRGVWLYILSIVPNWADAEEIHQETNVKLWQEFGKFTPGSNFAAWARTIARFEVLSFRERRQRDWLYLSEQFLDLVDGDVEAVVDRGKTRQDVLADCVDELSPFNRELVRLHYTVGCKIKEIAGKVGRTPEAVYKILQRTRLELRQCVDRKVHGEGRP
jgi:RNA polymerase sigma-70 factor (ECF subfamily)